MSFLSRYVSLAFLRSQKFCIRILDFIKRLFKPHKISAEKFQANIEELRVKAGGRFGFNDLLWWDKERCSDIHQIKMNKAFSERDYDGYKKALLELKQSRDLTRTAEKNLRHLEDRLSPQGIEIIKENGGSEWLDELIDWIWKYTNNSMFIKTSNDIERMITSGNYKLFRAAIRELSDTRSELNPKFESVIDELGGSKWFEAIREWARDNLDSQDSEASLPWREAFENTTKIHKRFESWVLYHLNLESGLDNYIEMDIIRVAEWLTNDEKKMKQCSVLIQAIEENGGFDEHLKLLNWAKNYSKATKMNCAEYLSYMTTRIINQEFDFAIDAFTEFKNGYDGHPD